jgi:hypothetical protein
MANRAGATANMTVHVSGARARGNVPHHDAVKRSVRPLDRTGARDVCARRRVLQFSIAAPIAFHRINSEGIAS